VNSSEDDERRKQPETWPQAVAHQAAGVLMIRLAVPIEEAVGYLSRVADETGVEVASLADLIVRAAQTDPAD